MIDKTQKIRIVESEQKCFGDHLQKGDTMKIDVRKMERAFRKVDSYTFDFESFKPRKVPIEDIQDIEELSELLYHTIELQDRTVILATIRVRTEALLSKNAGLQDCLRLYCDLPENSEAERIVGVRIVKLLREKVAEFPDFKSAYEAYESESGDMEFFHQTLMRLIGEKFFPDK